MGRATSGVTGMKFRANDALLSMSVIRSSEAAEVDEPQQYVFTMTDGGFAKRTVIEEYRAQGRGGLGIKAMALANEDRGVLVGAFIVVEGDEVLSVTAGGQVVRSPINSEFRATGRSTMGVKFVTPKSGDSVAAVARSVERTDDSEENLEEATEGGTDAVEAAVAEIESDNPTEEA